MSNLYPRVHVMLACDEIDAASQPAVFNLTGARFGIRAPRFPHKQAELYVYMQVTGHPGSTTGQLQIIQADADEPIVESAELNVTLLGPLTIVPLVWSFHDCVFPTAGLYYIQCYFEQKLVNERLFILTDDVGRTNGQISP